MASEAKAKYRAPPRLRADLQSSRTIDGFCYRQTICRAMFYKLEAEGKAPRTYYVGTRRIVSPEAEAEWVAEREAEAQSSVVR
jgi:hypothetical protein